MRRGSRGDNPTRVVLAPLNLKTADVALVGLTAQSLSSRFVTTGSTTGVRVIGQDVAGYDPSNAE